MMDTEGWLDFLGGGEEKPQEEKPPEKPQEEGKETFKIPKVVIESGEITVEEPGTISVRFKNKFTSASVVVIGEETKTIDVNPPKISVNKLKKLSSIRLERIRVSIPTMRVSKAFNLKKFKINPKAVTSDIRTAANSLPKISIPTANANSIINKLGLGKGQTLSKSADNLKKSGLSAIKPPKIEIPKIDKYPTVKGIKFPKVYYAVFIPRRKNKKGKTISSIPKNCPYTGWVIPFLETPDIAAFKDPNKKIKAVYNKVNKLFPIDKPEWDGSYWAVYTTIEGVESALKYEYGAKTYKNFLDTTGEWKVWVVGLDNLKWPLGKLMSAVSTSFFVASAKVQDKIVSTFKSLTDTVDKYTVGKPTKKKTEKMSVTVTTINKQYLDQLRGSLKAYHRNPSKQNAKAVRQYLERVVKPSKYNPKMETFTVDITGGINGAMAVMTDIINYNIDAMNLIMDAIPITIFGDMGMEIDTLFKNTGKMLSNIVISTRSTITEIIGKYNKMVTKLNDGLESQRQRIKKTMLESATSIEKTIRRYNDMVEEANDRLIQLSNDINKQLVKVRNSISDTVDSVNSMIESAERNINTNIITEVNKTIDTINSFIDSINTHRKPPVNISQTRILTPVTYGPTGFTVNAQKGKIKYIAIGISQ